LKRSLILAVYNYGKIVNMEKYGKNFEMRKTESMENSLWKSMDLYNASSNFP
jgi:hypothetical protein